MFTHVNGYIHIDDRHIIVHTEFLSPSLTKKQMRELCRQTFPSLFQSGLLLKKQPSIKIGSCFKMIPSWFDRAIQKADTENDWDKFPYVALESGNGLISLTPLPR